MILKKRQAYNISRPKSVKQYELLIQEIVQEIYAKSLIKTTTKFMHY